MKRVTKGVVSYSGKEVFVGIDVHRKEYAVSVVCEDELVMRYRIAGVPGLLIESIKRRFNGAKIKSAYEAGFSGFVLHRELIAAGIENILVNAASIEINARDRVKTDKRDSQKIAVQLSKGSLRGIRIPSVEEEQARVVTRTREQLIKHRSSYMIEIRMKLHQFGLLPISYDTPLTLKAVEQWLAEPKFPELLKVAICTLVSGWKGINEQLKVLKAQLEKQAENDPREAVYRSVPGIGPLGARVLSNELGDMSQFANERQLFSFSGMTPTEFSTGEKTHRGHISRQGSPRLRKTLVEAAWVAIRYDPALRAVYERIAKKSGGKRAIIGVARRLLGRIRHLFLNKELYVLDTRETTQQLAAAA
jgi:transposase